MSTRDLVKSEREYLEHIVDHAGIESVLMALSELCGDKAEHLATNWQDTTSAKVWTQRSRKLEEIATTILFNE